MSDWVVTPRETPEALRPEFHAEPYNDPFLGRLIDRFDGATVEQLMAMARGGVGEPVGE